MRKTIIPLAVAPVLLLGMFAMPHAMAGNLNGDGALIGDETHPVKAAVSKVLVMPVGTDIPNANFEFDFLPVTVDGTAYVASPANMPPIGPLTVNLSTGATPLPPGTDTISYYKESTEFLGAVNFPHAGTYVYTVTESSTNNPTIAADPDHQKLTYSGALYTLTIYVANKTVGTGTYVYALTTMQTKHDDGTAGTTKVDPTPGGDGTTYNYSQMIFTNDFVKTNGSDDPKNPDPTDPKDSTLTVEKHVSGLLASTTEYFNYTMTITPPSLVTSPPTFYRAYLVENGAVIDPSTNAAAALIGQDATGHMYKYIKVSISDPTSFTLRDGQSLVFVDTPVGTGYTVTEDNPTGYDAALVVTTNNSPATAIHGATVGASVASGPQRVGELANGDKFTNTRNMITPTGLTMSMVPFAGVVLAALVALGLFGWMTVRGKKRQAA